MKLFCDFHQVNPAGWKCETCRSGVCQDCLNEPMFHQESLSCPHCRNSLSEIRQQTRRLSLWQHYRDVLSLPWQFQPLILGLLVSGGAFFAVWAGLGADAVLATVAVLSLAYGACLIKALSEYRGKVFKISSVLSRDLKPERKQLLAQVGLSAVSVGFLLLAQQHSTLLFFGSAVLMFFCLPLFLILPFNRAVDRDTALINRLIRTMAHLEADYFAAGVIALILGFAMAVGLDLVEHYVSAAARAPVASWLLWTILLTWSATLGYLVHELNRQASGNEAGAAPATARRSLDRKIDLALLRGDYDAVLGMLESACFRSQMPDYRLEQLYQLLMAQGNWTGLQKYSYSIMTLMLNSGRFKELSGFLKALKRNNPRYRIRDAELCLQVARACVKCDEPRLLLWIIQEAHLRFPESPEVIAELYREAGKILHQEFSEYRKALAYLRYASKAEQA